METINYEDFPVNNHDKEVYIHFYIYCCLVCFNIILIIITHIYQTNKDKIYNIIDCIIISGFIFFVYTYYSLIMLMMGKNYNDKYLLLIENIDFCKDDTFYAITNYTQNCFNENITCSCLYKSTCINFDNTKIDCINKEIKPYYTNDYENIGNHYDTIIILYVIGSLIILMIMSYYYNKIVCEEKNELNDEIIELENKRLHREFEMLQKQNEEIIKALEEKKEALEEKKEEKESYYYQITKYIEELL